MKPMEELKYGPHKRRVELARLIEELNASNDREIETPEQLEKMVNEIDKIKEQIKCRLRKNYQDEVQRLAIENTQLQEVAKLHQRILDLTIEKNMVTEELQVQLSKTEKVGKEMEMMILEYDKATTVTNTRPKDMEAMTMKIKEILAKHFNIHVSNLLADDLNEHAVAEKGTNPDTLEDITDLSQGDKQTEPAEVIMASIASKNADDGNDMVAVPERPASKEDVSLSKPTSNGKRKLNDISVKPTLKAAETNAGEPFSSHSDVPTVHCPSSDDSDMENLNASLCCKTHKYKSVDDMLQAFQEDPKLLIDAICNLYRLEILQQKSSAGVVNPSKDLDIIATPRVRGIVEYLVDGDPEFKNRKPLTEVIVQRLSALQPCMMLANLYKEKLFKMGASCSSHSYVLKVHCPSSDDSDVENLNASLRCKTHKFKSVDDMLQAFQEDPKLRVDAICDLYRLEILQQKSTNGVNPSKDLEIIATPRVRDIVEYLADGDPEFKNGKPLTERPSALQHCTMLSNMCNEKLFEMMCCDGLGPSEPSRRSTRIRKLNSKYSMENYE